MEDYEQLYYDALYTIKQLKEKNESLESDLQLINSNQKKRINIKNIILEQMKKYKEEDNMKGEILSLETAEMKVKCSHQKKVIDRLSRKIQRLKKTKKDKQVFDKLEFIKNRAIAGATQETINKLAIDFVNSYLKEEI